MPHKFWSREEDISPQTDDKDTDFLFVSFVGSLIWLAVLGVIWVIAKREPAFVAWFIAIVAFAIGYIKRHTLEQKIVVNGLPFLYSGVTFVTFAMFMAIIFGWSEFFKICLVYLVALCLWLVSEWWRKSIKL